MGLILPAYAKLNLTLDVTGRRANGYHEIDSVMQTISLHDVISVERTDCRVFDVVGPAISGENLVLKAARELEGHVGRALPFTIRLFKRIPMFAGLGGGSADAAAFLLAAVQLYQLPIKQDALVELATAVGQDVPFFLSGGTARATGLGSTVESLPEPAGILAIRRRVSAGRGPHPGGLRGGRRWRTDRAPDTGPGRTPALGGRDRPGRLWE